MKYRIVYAGSDDKYYPQCKWWFWWVNFEIGLTEKQVSFHTKELAVEFLEKRIAADKREKTSLVVWTGES